MENPGLVLPILALVLWSLVVWLWMYATRIPAMQAARIDPQEAARTRTLNLPPEIMQISDNYNHLMEQPTIFYAIVFALILMGDSQPTPPDAFEVASYLTHGDWDEHPLQRVTLTQDFKCPKRIPPRS